MSVLDDLSTLQELDGEIRELERHVNDIPVRREQEIQELAAEQDDLNRAREEVNRLILETRNDEVVISEIKENIAKFRTQQMSLKTNAEYAAMNSQIAKAEEAQKAAEAKLAEDKAKIPAASAGGLPGGLRRGQGRGGRLHRRSGRTARRDPEAPRRRPRLRRAAMAKPLDVPATRKFLMYYDRLRKSRWPVLIRLDAGVCTGCHMQLPPAKQQDAVEKRRDGHRPGEDGHRRLRLLQPDDPLALSIPFNVSVRWTTDRRACSTARRKVRTPQGKASWCSAGRGAGKPR